MQPIKGNRKFHSYGGSLFLVPLLLTVLVAGCASGPSEPGNQSTADESGSRILTPNPYLANPGSVPSAARSAIGRARDYYQAQNYPAAETELQQVVSQWPELSGAWLNLAKVQLKLEKSEQAEISLNQSVSANENNVFAWNSLGVLLRDQGRFEEAEKAYQNALDRWPDFAAGHRNLGILYDLYLHKPEPALQHYRTAQELQEEEDRVLMGWIMDLERRM